MKKDKLVLWSILAVILLAFYWGYERFSSIKKEEARIKAEEIAEIKQSQTTFDNAIASKLFGIKLGDSAIKLISGLNNWEPSDKEYENWFEPSGLLKGTRNDFLSATEFILNLNDFISGETLDWLVLYKNKDFEDYYIKYQPYGDYKITSIIGSLKRRYRDYDECVTALRPYATVIVERIRKENPDKHIVMEDMFFPKIDGEYNSAKILFKYKKRRSYLDGKWILTLQSHCNPFSDGKSHIELKAPSLGIELKTYQKIMKKINQQKEIDLKKEFDENAKEAKPEIDKSGL
jgi:hypothetical protein